MKFIINTLSVFILLIPVVLFAQADSSKLVEIPIQGSDDGLGGYINTLYFLAISIAAILAVIKLIIGGVKYMLTDVVTSKADAKSEIKGALLGLLLIISAFVILNTINGQIIENRALDGIDKVDQSTPARGAGGGIIQTPNPGSMSTTTIGEGRTALRDARLDCENPPKYGRFTVTGSSGSCQLPSSVEQYPGSECTGRCSQTAATKKYNTWVNECTSTGGITKGSRPDTVCVKY